MEKKKKIMSVTISGLKEMKWFKNYFCFILIFILKFEYLKSCFW